MIKIQKPQARDQVTADLDIVRRLARRLEASTAWGRSLGVVTLAEGSPSHFARSWTTGSRPTTRSPSRPPRIRRQDYSQAETGRTGLIGHRHRPSQTGQPDENVAAVGAELPLPHLTPHL